MPPRYDYDFDDDDVDDDDNDDDYYRYHQYCREKVLGWKGELEALPEIARSQPHVAYTVFTKGYKSKFTYFMRTIESFEDYVDPIQEAIDDSLLPKLFGERSPFLVISVSSSLCPAQGGLGVPD